MTIKDIGAKLRDIFIPCRSNNFRPKFLDSNFLIYYLAVLIVIKFVVLPTSFCFYKSSYFATLTREFLVTLTNEERKSLGLGELQENSTLDQAAAAKAQDMLDLDYFSHNSPEGKTPWYWMKLSGYNYQKAGENLAIGFVDGEEVIQAWNESPSHRANIVNSGYREIGIGIAKGDFQGQEVTVVVQMFGTKLNGQTQTAPAKASVAAGASQTNKSADNSQPSQPVQTIGEKKASTTAQTSQNGISQNQPVQMNSQPSQPVQTSTVILAGTEPEVEGAQTQTAENPERSIGFREMSLKFLVFGLPGLIEKLNFLSLLVAMIGLLLTIFIEIRVQPKDLLLKGFFFILVFGILLVFDKTIILRFIPHNLVIG